MTQIGPSILTAAALLSFEAATDRDQALAAQEYDNAPWCAVIDVGDGDMKWECEYNTVEECVPNVLAGNRGFCELNPYGGHPTANVPISPRARRQAPYP